MTHLTVGDSVVGVITEPAGGPSGPDGYAITRGGTDTTALQVGTVTGTPAGGDVTVTPTVLHVPYPWADPVPAPQQGGPLQLPDDFYPKQATVTAGGVWFAMTEPCTPTGDDTVRDCVHVVQVDTTGPAPTLVQETEVSVPGAYLLTPAVAVDGQGRAVVEATETNATMHPSVVAIAMRADGSYGPPTVVRAGQAYTTTDNYAPGLIRWGDYSSAVVDPTDPTTVWVGGEYAYDSWRWGTGIAAVHVDDPTCPPPTACAPGSYHPITPTRVLDTRTGLGIGTGAPAPVAGGNPLTLPVTGHAGIPATGVGTVTFTLTATDTTGAGYVTAAPTGPPPPFASNLNFAPGQTIADQVTVPVGADGTITLTVGPAATVTTDLLADLTGYTLGGRATLPGAYTSVPPTRLLDTRTGSPAGPVAGGSDVTVSVAGQGGVPATGIAAATFTLTATDVTGSGFVTAYPHDRSLPTASNLNLTTGQTIADQVTVPLAADGTITLHLGPTTTALSADLLLDLSGYTLTGEPDQTGQPQQPTGAPGTYTPVTPTRVLDTRTGLGTPTGIPDPVDGGASLTLTLAGHAGLPTTGLGTVTLTLTATDTTAAGYASLTADPTTPPGTSNLNVSPGQTIADQVTAPVNPDGTVTVHLGPAINTPLADLIADVTGYTHPSD